ncbi:MAG: hypothetical protein KUG50_00995 [Cycloclasticus sp.]|nr:hypothetical protein [Cycloclasticus sp.]
MLIALILLLLVISGFFYYKNIAFTKTSTSAGDPIMLQQQRIQSMIDSKKYWGFYIDFINNKKCCEAVLTLNKKPFPINSVPALPLDDCSNKKCNCKHVGLVEKRKPLHQQCKKNDRRNAIRLEEVSDRRAHMDRRSDNWVQHRD